MASIDTKTKSKGLDEQIDSLLQERASLISTLEVRLAEFNEKMTNLHNHEQASKWSSMVETRRKNLEMKHKMLELSLK